MDKKESKGDLGLGSSVEGFDRAYREAHMRSFPSFESGDTVNVHVKIREGDKERVQQFQGVVVQRRNKGKNGETFTVRKVSEGIEVERIFPVLSPNVEKVELVREGVVRRARLYYLRGRKGRSARIKEKVRGKSASASAEVSDAQASLSGEKVSG